MGTNFLTIHHNYCAQLICASGILETVEQFACVVCTFNFHN